MTPFQKSFSQARKQYGADGQFDFEGKKYNTRLAEDAPRQQAIRQKAEAPELPPIVDNSGPIAPGVVESGQTSQEDFDKIRGNNKEEEFDAAGAVNSLASALKPKEEMPATQYRPFTVDDNSTPIKDVMSARREALMKMMGGR